MNFKLLGTISGILLFALVFGIFLHFSDSDSSELLNSNEIEVQLSSSGNSNESWSKREDKEETSDEKWDRIMREAIAVGNGATPRKNRDILRNKKSDNAKHNPNQDWGKAGNAGKKNSGQQGNYSGNGNNSKGNNTKATANNSNAKDGAGARIRTNNNSRKNGTRRKNSNNIFPFASRKHDVFPGKVSAFVATIGN